MKKSFVFKLFYIIIPVSVVLLWGRLDDKIEIKGIASGRSQKVNLKKFVKVPAGDFYIGDNLFSVSGFYISKTEVTVKEYFEITGKNPTSHDDDSDFPVANVSWNDAAAYCNALSAAQNLRQVYEIDANGNVTGFDLSKNGYRLPTKNEWYFAAIGAGYNENDKSNAREYIERVAWFYRNSKHSAQPVAKKEPNSLGIYDMRGNVSEWCNDDAWYWNDADALEIEDDFCYESDKENSEKAICGGFYDNSAQKLDFLECQDLCLPDKTNVCYGFRIARTKR